MKKISKKTNIQFLKQFNKPITFQDTQIVTETGHFVQPSSQTSFKHEKLLIICKGHGNQAVQIANQVLQLLKQSMLALVNEQSKLHKQSQQLLGNELTEQSKQRYFILNLIDSCFQELSSKHYDASCSFGMVYIFNNSLYIVKNKNIECYFVTEKYDRSLELKPLTSKSLPFQIKILSSIYFIIEDTDQNTKQGFFTSDQNYENITTKKYFPEVSFFNTKIQKQDQIVFLMGNSETFCHFIPEQLTSILVKQRTFKEAGTQVIQISKKKWKTIYQQDTTLIISRIS